MLLARFELLATYDCSGFRDCRAVLVLPVFCGVIFNQAELFLRIATDPSPSRCTAGSGESGAVEWCGGHFGSRVVAASSSGLRLPQLNPSVRRAPRVTMKSRRIILWVALRRVCQVRGA